MRLVFDLWERKKSPKLPAMQWRSILGDDRVDTLLRLGILSRRAVAEHYVCGNGDGMCTREIERVHGRPGTPWGAFCREDPPQCLPTFLTDAQVEEYQMRHEVLVEALRSAIGVQGPGREMPALESTHMGTLLVGREAVEAFLCLGFRPAIRALLAERPEHGRRSVVFLPTGRLSTPELTSRYAIGGSVVLGFLEDVLEIENGRIVPNAQFATLVSRPAKEAGPYCFLQTHEGRRGISEAEADAIVANRDQYDMFVDAVHVHARGKYAVGKRNEKGVVEVALISRARAFALVELVELGVPVDPRNLAAFQNESVESPIRMIQRARESVDVRDSTGWHAFHAVTGEGVALQRYVFRPRAGMTYAILIPCRTTLADEGT